MSAATTTAASPPQADTIEQIVRRASALYSLPSVAMEVLSLTQQEKVDVPALKECIERDPALTVKILRVVNSSIFGLPREVSDLNQALALLGIKPLKLLALGFSLPESLFVRTAREQLDWYWKSALVRALAAREISEQLFKRPGDDAFLAGLLQDLGVLVLLGELGQPYAALLTEAIAARADLNQLETESLGFDHVQLTAGLLEHWNLPKGLVAAIGEPRDYHRWARSKAEHAHLVRVLHLAELFAQLVGQRRLNVLPDLLEVGEAYCQLDKPRLNELVEGLEPKVQQLASVLSLDFDDDGDYVQILVQAHEQMSRVAESVAGTLSRGLATEAAGAIECEPHEVQALALARQLRASFEDFFAQPETQRPARPHVHRVEHETASPETTHSPPFVESPDRRRRSLAEQDELSIRLTLSVGRCRVARQPLGVILLAAEAVGQLSSAEQQRLQRALDAACQELGADCENIERAGEPRRLLVLAGHDRLETVATARNMVEQARRMIQKSHQAGLLPTCVVAAGVAWAATPAKNFRPITLLETAQRCLAAARTSGGVKSLEVS